MTTLLRILNALKESGCFVGDIDEAISEVKAKDKEAAKLALVDAISLLDKAGGRGIFKPNKVANQKSQLQSAVNALE